MDDLNNKSWLPTWMKLSKNREEILESIEKLKQKF
jgi:hypothetical protein